MVQYSEHIVEFLKQVDVVMKQQPLYEVLWKNLQRVERQNNKFTSRN